ncbi:YheT family hydrolase [Flammeovirga sp. OC4]|uniref:YheT family hydrolase n=1 Tax=Flammeovirga sp. OC4 TaxID=1382345 RepID=UPI0005C4721A|nr:alpha/beta fold hydrolase [Flammeovirga sp. OC4]
MPIINSQFSPNFWFKNPHINTIFSNRIKKQKSPKYLRKRYETADNDFFDVDTILSESDTAVIILHGLEGSSKSGYILEIADYFSKTWDVWAMNHKSCSGELNLRKTSYHSGRTEELIFLLDEIIDNYRKIYIVGFSLGGNITLKYLGENAQELHPKIKAAVAISAPVHLNSSARTLQERKNWFYLNDFLVSLKKKAIEKIRREDPDSAKILLLEKATTFVEFDNLYTAPVHGFLDAEDYWTKCSSRQFLPEISIPTLILNAEDDPFLSDECYPYTEAMGNQQLYLEVPKYGGHVGFMESSGRDRWYLHRLMTFLKNY